MKQLNHYQPTRAMEQLFEAILQLKTTEEAAKFLRDLLTLPELKEFSNRWQIVRLLLQGESYIIIANKLGVSTTTVTRVAQWFNNGEGGYKLVADRLKLTKTP